MLGLEYKRVAIRRARIFKEHYKIRDKTVAATVAGMLFTIIICLAVIRAFTRDPDRDPTKYQRNLMSSQTKETNCKSNGNEISCSNFETSSELESEMDSLDLEGISEIILKTNAFTEGRIPTKWLKKATIKIKVKLTVDLESVSNIETEAFSADIFKQITGLHLKSTKIKYLDANIFEGITQLQTLWIGCTLNDNIDFENDFLRYISNSLNTLQFESCTLASASIAKLTNSDSNLQKLVSIDLSDNNINSLENNVFSKAPNLQQLFIRRTNLNDLMKGAFGKLSSIIQIYMNSNNLDYIEEGIFDLIKGPSAQVYLDENPWKCDCDLKWLKDEYMKDGTYINKNNPLVCSNYNNEKFENVEFCDESTTGWDEPTTTECTTVEATTTEFITTHSSSTESQTQNCTPLESVELSCNNENSTSKCPLHTINNEAYVISIFEEDIHSPEAKITFKMNLCNQHYLTYFKSYHFENATQCILLPDTTEISITGMIRKETYTICISPELEVVHSLHGKLTNCYGLTVPAIYNERTWLANKHKRISIILIFIIFSVIIILSTLLTYWIVRRFPRLIKGSNRVLVLGRNRPILSTSSPSYESTPPYLSPITGCTPNNSRRSSLSFASSRASSISYITPSLVSHWTYKKRNNKKCLHRINGNNLSYLPSRTQCRNHCV